MGDRVTIVLQGTATDIQTLKVEISPDFGLLKYVEYVRPCAGSDPTYQCSNPLNPPPATSQLYGLRFVGAFLDGSASPLPPDFNLAEQPPLVFGLLSNNFDPSTGEPFPFTLVDGPLVALTLEGLAPGKTTLPFIVTTFDDLFAEKPIPTVTELTFEVTIREKTNNVPEPATLWLAVAALIAGGLMFRKDSKSS